MKIKLFAGCATSVSRSAPKRKKRNSRSAFLSKFMGKMSGGAGDAVIHAFAQQDANAFKAAFTNVMNAIIETFDTSNVNNTEVRSKSMACTAANIHDAAPVFGVKARMENNVLSLSGDAASIDMLCGIFRFPASTQICVSSDDMEAELSRLSASTLHPNDLKGSFYTLKGQALSLVGDFPKSKAYIVDLASLRVPQGDFLHFLESKGCSQRTALKNPGEAHYE